jgi:hypothetical protein
LADKPGGTLGEPHRLEEGGEARAGRFEFGAEALENGGGKERTLRGTGTGENAEKSVVVPLADGVELVFVAPGAGDGQPKRGLGDDVDLVVRDLTSSSRASTGQ